MLILFDHGTPKGLARALSGHTVFTAQTKGWDRLAEELAFDLFLTTDRRTRYQQNLTGRKNAATPGSYVEVAIPFSEKRQQQNYL